MEPLNWAALGVDDELVEAVRWLVGPQSANQLVVCSAAEGYESVLRTLAPRAAIDTHWEALVGAPNVQAVIVGRRPFAQRQQALRQLAQSVPMLLMFPADDSLFACELDMIRREHATCLMPYAPAALHPAIERMAAWIAQGEESPLGTVEQIAFERLAADRSKERVLELFARDALILQALGGRIEQLGALGASDDQQDYSNVSVHLKLERGHLVRWSVHPGSSNPGGALSLVGRSASVRLDLDGDPARWTLTPAQADWFATDWTSAGAMFGHFRQALRRPDGRLDWSWAYRALEAAEGIETSCRRGKVVEFYGRTVTEQTTFKGMMAAGGCFLLLASLAILMVVLLVDALQLPLGQWWVWRQWPWLLLVPLAAFLLLQALQLVFPPDSSTESAEADR